MEDAGASDAVLVERAQQGDVDAYADLVRRYQAIAVGTARLILGGAEDGEDAAQEAFLKAYYALDRFQPHRPFRPWLLQIVVHEARNLRKSVRRSSARVERVAGAVGVAHVTPSAEHEALEQVQRQALLEALDDLSESDRLAIAYRYVFDLSEAETADTLGWPRGTVKSRLARGLERLRRRTEQLVPGLLPVPLLWGAGGDQALAWLRANWLASPTRDLVQTVLQPLRASGLVGGGPGAPANQRSGSQPASLLVGACAVIASMGLLAWTVGQPVPASPPPASAPTPSPELPRVAVYGADLTAGERAELAAWFSQAGPTSQAAVSQTDLANDLQAAPAADASDQAISSAVVICQPPGAGVHVRTRAITQVPAATYALAGLVAGLRDGVILVAAPVDHPVSGESALVGVLKAIPTCPNGVSEASRAQLASQLFRVTAAAAEALGSWEQAAAIVGAAAEPAIRGQAPDAQTVTALARTATNDPATTLPGEVQDQLVDVLGQVATLDFGRYAAGASVQQRAADDAAIQALASPTPVAAS